MRLLPLIGVFLTVHAVACCVTGGCGPKVKVITKSILTSGVGQKGCAPSAAAAPSIGIFAVGNLQGAQNQADLALTRQAQSIYQNVVGSGAGLANAGADDEHNVDVFIDTATGNAYQNVNGATSTGQSVQQTSSQQGAAQQAAQQITFQQAQQGSAQQAQQVQQVQQISAPQGTQQGAQQVIYNQAGGVQGAGTFGLNDASTGISNSAAQAANQYSVDSSGAQASGAAINEGGFDNFGASATNIANQNLAASTLVNGAQTTGAQSTGTQTGTQYTQVQGLGTQSNEAQQILGAQSNGAQINGNQYNGGQVTSIDGSSTTSSQTGFVDGGSVISTSGSTAVTASSSTTSSTGECANGCMNGKCTEANCEMTQVNVAPTHANIDIGFNQNDYGVNDRLAIRDFKILKSNAKPTQKSDTAYVQAAAERYQNLVRDRGSNLQNLISAKDNRLSAANSRIQTFQNALSSINQKKAVLPAYQAPVVSKVSYYQASTPTIQQQSFNTNMNIGQTFEYKNKLCAMTCCEDQVKAIASGCVCSNVVARK